MVRMKFDRRMDLTTAKDTIYKTYPRKILLFHSFVFSLCGTGNIFVLFSKTQNKKLVKKKGRFSLPHHPTSYSSFLFLQTLPSKFAVQMERHLMYSKLGRNE